MSREIAFEPKVLLTGVVGAVFALVWALATGSALGLAVVWAVLGGVIALVVATVMLELVAHYMVARNIDGLGRKQAALYAAVAVATIALFFTAYSVLSGQIEALLHRYISPIAGMLFVVVCFVYAVRVALRERRERGKLKTIDLSRKRDLTLR